MDTLSPARMTSAQSKRQKLSAAAASQAEQSSSAASQSEEAAGGRAGKAAASGGSCDEPRANNFGVDVDDLTDDTDCEVEEEEEAEDELLGDKLTNHLDIQQQLAAAGPAGVAAAAAIATARKRKRPHSFETNPSVRKRQQTRIIRKMRACIDEYTMRVGQQAVVLITMPGKAVNNFKVFGAQPLESVIRACKGEIMSELEQALLERAPQQFKEDSNKHELPPLVIDGIPTPVEKMTQAQLRAFIPLMLKYSTGRGKPGWGKDTTRPPWWPESLPWANVRSDARDEGEKQRISWTTTLRQIVTNCYKYHGRDDLLPAFDESEPDSAQAAAAEKADARAAGPLAAGPPRHRAREPNAAGSLYASAGANAPYVMHTLANGDGTVSLIQLDPSNAQILTLPDGTQVRAVRLQTIGGPVGEQAGLCAGQQAVVQEGAELAPEGAQGVLSVSEAQLGADGQIIVMGEDGTQNCYPMSSLVSIPASMYQQFAQSGQQTLSLFEAEGGLPSGALTIHALPEESGPSQGAEGAEQQVLDQQVLVKAEEAKAPAKGDLAAAGN